jgi:16S rRNA (adenine1518-N6/adenine1519-N6)-dimethyltransferase
MDLTNEILLILSNYGIKPRKSLSQNFVTDSNLLDRMIDYADVNSKDVILEIGSGLGFLTEKISVKAHEVIAVEKDPVLIRILKNRLIDRKNIAIVESDILKLDNLLFDKVVSNPPYQLTSPLIFKLLKYPFKVLILTLQKEFAERLTASEGTREYGRLTVTANLTASSEIMEYITPSAFYPAPKVKSAVLKIIRREPPRRPRNEEFFNIFVRNLFTQRKKKSKKVIKRFIEEHLTPNDKCVDALIQGLPYISKRVFQLSPSEFIELSDLLWLAREDIARRCS